jgi:hypothetical protein
MDAEISKMTKKILEKQGMKFKLNTKVLNGDSSGETVKLEVEAAKGGKAETVSYSVRVYAFDRTILMPSSSLTQTSFLSPSAGAPTPQASVSKISASKSTTKAAS